MKMRGRAAVLMLGLMLSSFEANAKPAAGHRVTLEGDVTAGRSFEAVFSPGLKFVFEAIASGWIVRVVPATGPRAAHDYAELATPPYQSVTPLAVSTDFSFRSQDAVGWNPRRFRFARSADEFHKLATLYEAMVKGDSKAAADLATLTSQEPEAELTILDARIAPGTNDQAQMAAAVASHFESTPHTVETAAASRLGKLLSVHFRVTFTLCGGLAPAPGLKSENVISGGCSPVPNRKQP